MTNPWQQRQPKGSSRGGQFARSALPDQINGPLQHSSIDSYVTEIEIPDPVTPQSGSLLLTKHKKRWRLAPTLNMTPIGLDLMAASPQYATIYQNTVIRMVTGGLIADLLNQRELTIHQVRDLASATGWIDRERPAKRLTQTAEPPTPENIFQDALILRRELELVDEAHKCAQGYTGTLTYLTPEIAAANPIPSDNPLANDSFNQHFNGDAGTTLWIEGICRSSSQYSESIPQRKRYLGRSVISPRFLSRVHDLCWPNPTPAFAPAFRAGKEILVARFQALHRSSDALQNWLFADASSRLRHYTETPHTVVELFDIAMNRTYKDALDCAAALGVIGQSGAHSLYRDSAADYAIDEKHLALYCVFGQAQASINRHTIDALVNNSPWVQQAQRSQVQIASTFSKCPRLATALTEVVSAPAKELRQFQDRYYPRSLDEGAPLLQLYRG